MDWGFTYRGIHSSEKGLRIANISGRDTLPDIESRTAQTASKHGLHYYGYRFQERRIRAEITLYGSSLSNFRSKIREIAAWLNPYDGPGELIFDDEPDKKYYAVITENTDFEGMFIKRVAEIEFLCPDPFAYAISETAASISGNSLTIDNDGTAETFPVIEITADGSAGPDNFEGKIAGSTVENPHTIKFTSYPTLREPANIPFEIPQGSYINASFLDGNVTRHLNSTYKNIAMQMFSFNLIALIKRKFGFTVPGANLAEQVQWLKTNISQITANWWGKGTNKQANPTGIANFVGKVKGSTVENPHKAYRHGVASAPVSPTSHTVELDTGTGTTGYGTIESLNGTIVAQSASAAGNIAQMLFSFDLIEYVQRKYSVTVPGATTADKIQWLKDNISLLRVNWHGYGIGPSGNAAWLNLWRGDTLAWYSTPRSHTSGTVAIIEFDTTATTVFIDVDGFLHCVAYSEASDGTTSGQIRTDYVELEVELKAGQDKANFTRWRATGSWNTFAQSNDTNGIALISYALPNSALSDGIDSNGFCHFLAYAEPSNGISPSTIETDYIELKVLLSKTEGIKVSNGDEFIAIQRSLATGDKVKIDNERGTITLNGTTDIISSLDIDSDFFAIKSGSSTLTVGGGNGTVRYTKRWL
ncbi:phage tail family protein [Cytobacillus firmus]|uniref:distal tail protein Dit n=1 Tax=Cytobacillus firmus TaxID=1399 RepID=UPI00203C8CA4|nr:distal tail protein Dit [Cytobacillus firmus]MCM3705312.1 phage tail family protein [Cytobacillus firmus]